MAVAITGAIGIFGNWLTVSLNSKREREQWNRQQQSEQEKWAQRRADEEKQQLQKTLQEIYSNAAYYCGIKETPGRLKTSGIAPGALNQFEFEQDKRTIETYAERMKWLFLLAAYAIDTPNGAGAEIRSNAANDFITVEEILLMAKEDPRLSA